MEGTRNGKQGVGCPVPVGIAGERAGLARPLASHYSALSVDSQAEVQRRGRKGVWNSSQERPWRVQLEGNDRPVRKAGFNRKIPTRLSTEERCNPREVLKKKANPVAADFMDMLELLQKASTKLNCVMSAHLNTKKKIKEVNNDLQRIGMFLKRSSVEDLLDSVKWEKVETPTYDADNQTENKLAKPTTVTIGVQTDWSGIKKEQEILAEKESCPCSHHQVVLRDWRRS
nr:unnamed protein product [Callosobruchus chinensis]